MGRIVWSVREGEVGEFDAPEVMGGFRSADREPTLGDLLVLPDGSGPWRVIDRMRADQGGTRALAAVERHDEPGAETRKPLRPFLDGALGALEEDAGGAVFEQGGNGGVIGANG